MEDFADGARIGASSRFAREAMELIPDFGELLHSPPAGILNTLDPLNSTPGIERVGYSSSIQTSIVFHKARIPGWSRQ